MKEDVSLNGIIVGHGYHIECIIRVTKTTLDSYPSAPPAYSDYRIMDSAVIDKLPDGDYEILVGDERLPLRKVNGRFRERPWSKARAAFDR